MQRLLKPFVVSLAVVNACAALVFLRGSYQLGPEYTVGHSMPAGRVIFVLVLAAQVWVAYLAVKWRPWRPIPVGGLDWRKWRVPALALLLLVAILDLYFIAIGVAVFLSAIFESKAFSAGVLLFGLSHG